MALSPSEKTQTGEPSSYKHIEQALSKATAEAGEDTKEANSGSKNFGSKGDEIRKTFDPQVNSNSSASTNGSDNFVLESTSQHEERTMNAITGEEAATKTTKLSVEPQTQPVAQITTKLSIPTSLTATESKNGKAAQKTTATPSENAVSGPPRLIHTGTSHLSQTRTVQSQILPTGSPSKSKTGMALRRGKWTMEEEAYVARVINDFNSGFLNAPAGTTLRSYLSEKLQCDPMRITKKFTGDACIGKRVFHPAVRSAGNAAAIDKAQAELDALERRWRRRLEMQQRESAKKAAASAAAASATSHARSAHVMIQGVPVTLLGGADSQGMAPGSSHFQQSAVTQAASWLDRANALLKGTKVDGSRSGGLALAGPAEESNAEIESQMKEVERLIREGPRIQQTSAALPQMLGNKGQTGTVNSFHAKGEHADKRMKMASLSGAEDAEALVGFLRSVQASAAAGQDL